MRLHREIVCCLDALRTTVQSRLGVADILRHLFLRHRALAPGLKDGGLIWESRAGGPVDSDRPRRLHCGPFMAGDDNAEVTLGHGLYESIPLAGRRLIDGRDAGAVMVGPDHASMQHV